jgi:hypothetical protein
MSHPQPTPGFDAGWLQQREPFDIAARDPLLLRRFVRTLQARRPSGALRLLDLAAGSGAQLRALAPHLERDQHWTLLDHDPALLAAQRDALAAWAAGRGDGFDTVPTTVRHGPLRWQVEHRAFDLAGDLAALDLAAFDGIVTTAFLDLVSAQWLDRFVVQLQAAQRPLWATLSVDGSRAWSPAEPDDAALHAAFSQHQAGDKGFGTALGGAAVEALAERLQALGWQVGTARADWHIGPREAAMLQRLADETALVAAEAAPALQAAATAWHRRRTEQIGTGTLRAEIGHLDLLALPPALA